MKMNDLKMEISYYENYIIRNKLFSKIGPNQIFIISQLMSLIPLEVVKDYDNFLYKVSTKENKDSSEQLVLIEIIFNHEEAPDKHKVFNYVFDWAPQNKELGLSFCERAYPYFKKLYKCFREQGVRERWFT